MSAWELSGMSQSANIFRSPVVRWGMPAMTATLIVAIAFLVIKEQALRLAMLGVAAVEFLVTPQILKRAA